MAQTTLSEIPGFILPGTTKVIALPSVASFPTITLSEISTTGTEVSKQVANGSNWQMSTANPSSGTLGSTFTAQARGMRSMSGTPSLVFRASKTGADIRGTWAIGDTKYMIFAWGGTGTGTFYDAFATEISNIFTVGDFSGGAFTLITVEFAVTQTPSLYQAYPAS
jgi:hypothetical protein